MKAWARCLPTSASDATHRIPLPQPGSARSPVLRANHPSHAQDQPIPPVSTGQLPRPAGEHDSDAGNSPGCAMPHPAPRRMPSATIRSAQNPSPGVLLPPGSDDVLLTQCCSLACSEFNTQSDAAKGWRCPEAYGQYPGRDAYSQNDEW